MSSANLLGQLDWDVVVPLEHGDRNTTPNSFCPWECLSEVLPGLFLTCEQQVEDRKGCLEKGISLVLRMNGSEYQPKYAVHTMCKATQMISCDKINTFDEFIEQIDQYFKKPLAPELADRMVFVFSVPAQDTPLYDISQHFTETSVIIEVAMRHLRRLLGDPNSPTPASSLPSIAVHCMVGVSRSTSVVAAYLMKRCRLSREAALDFIESIRPVINPNPGFQVQLNLWESMNYVRFTDELSTQLVAAEVSRKENPTEFLAPLASFLLESSKCSTERSNFGLLVSLIKQFEGDAITAFFRDLRSNITASIDSEIYTDIPNYFGYVAELVHSLDRYCVLCLRRCESECSDGYCWNDRFYHRIIKDIGRSGFEKECRDTSNAFCRLLSAIHEKHLSYTMGPRLIELSGISPGGVCQVDIAQTGESIPDIRLSFPFLIFTVPYAEGFVQLSELDAKLGDPSTSSEMCLQTVAHTMLSALLRTSNDYGDQWLHGWRLSHLQDDVEVTTFSKLASFLRSGQPVNADQLQLLSSPSLGRSPKVDAAIVRKIASACVAYRLFLEAVENFSSQLIATQTDTTTTTTTATESNFVWCEQHFPLSCLSTILSQLEQHCPQSAHHPLTLAAFLKRQLDPLQTGNVVSLHGVCTLFP